LYRHAFPIGRALLLYCLKICNYASGRVYSNKKPREQPDDELKFRTLLLLLLLLVLLLSSSSSSSSSLIAIELSLGGSSPYTSTDKTNKNKYT